MLFFSAAEAGRFILLRSRRRREERITEETMYLPAYLLVFSTFCICACGLSTLERFQSTPIQDGIHHLVLSRRSVAEASPPASSVGNSSFILAAERTRRKDPLDNFKYYKGGWNISNNHYWASVGFTVAPPFIVGAIWFVIFALVLLAMCCYFCCCRRRTYSYSRTAYALSLILLILFTCAAIIGCIILYHGQAKAHESTTDTLNYVVGQANVTVENLRNFSRTLSAAKQTGVDQVFMPSDVQARIDQIQTKVNKSANTLEHRADDNSDKIQDVLDNVRLDLIIVAAVMLLLTLLGFLFSVLGLQFLVYILVLLGWLLVAGTFILCGVFLLLHNVAADACVAMDEWVLHPAERTALDDILPCVDNTTANASLKQSKESTFQLINVVNQVINNVSNQNFPPFIPLYFNQSGPLMPVLCNPFHADLSDRECKTGEVGFNNASQVWEKYVCKVSSAGVCVTVGRVTPSIYNQMKSAVTLSYGLYRYTPFLVQLEDCTFVRDTFTTISKQKCPGLRRYTKRIYIGLVMVSVSVMLSLIFWVIYARERRHRKYNKQFIQN